MTYKQPVFLDSKKESAWRNQHDRFSFALDDLMNAYPDKEIIISWKIITVLKDMSALEMVISGKDAKDPVVRPKIDELRSDLLHQIPFDELPPQD